MAYRPGPGEPYAGPFGAISLTALLRDAPRVVLIDGRGGSGKTTLASQIAHLLPNSVVVHTDDVAWHHSLFDWHDLLHDHILQPFLAGHPVDYVPPGWQKKSRPGSITVPGSARHLVIEGSGSIHAPLVQHADLTVWIQGDIAEQRARGIERDIASGVNGNREEATRFWDEWAAEEIAFFQSTRPWDRADVIVETRAESAGDTVFGTIKR